MNKIKLMFCAITLFGVIGGALAFKVSKYGLFHIYTTGGTTGETRCTVDFGIYTNGSPGDPTLWASYTYDGPCTTLTITVE